jgi:transposase InsO family protein
MLNINWENVREAIENTNKGGRGLIIEKYAALYGVSKDSIYRELRRRFGKKKTINRKKRVPQRLIDEIARIKLYGMKMQIDERELSTEICIEKLIKRQVEGAELLTVSSVNRRLEEAGFRLRDPIVRVESNYPNQLHEFDFTRSKYFQLVGNDDQDWLIKCSGRELHYKQDDRRFRLWIVSLIDSYSRIELARAYPATSESVDLGLSHLHYTYNRPPDQLHLSKLPDIFKTDQGSFGKSADVRAMFDRLGIIMQLSKPYKKRGIQKEESSHRTRWQQFELSLAVDLGPGHILKLSEYNELLFEKCVRDQDRMHPVRNDTRRGAYLSGISGREVKELDIDLREVAFKTWERKVKDTLTVSIDGSLFTCPENTQGKIVRVYRNRLGEFVGHVVDEIDKPFILKHTKGYVELGDFAHRPHATYRQQIEIHVEQDLKEGNRLFLGPKVKKIKPASVFEDAVIKSNEFQDNYKAKVYIGRNLPPGQTYADYADIFDDLLQQDLSKSSIDAVLKVINKNIMTGAV